MSLQLPGGHRPEPDSQTKRAEVPHPKLSPEQFKCILGF